MKAAYVTRAFQATDERSLFALVKDTFGFSEELWRWKHLLYPNFTSSSIIVADRDGRIIGTSSWIPRELRISLELTVKSALGGDTAVATDCRGQGVGHNIMKFFYEELGKSEVIVITGFATRQVATRFYAPLGSVLMKDFTTTYTKYPNLNQWKRKLNAGSESSEIPKERLGEREFRIRLDLHGAPPFMLIAKGGRIFIEECSGESRMKANVTIHSELSHLIPFFQGEKGILSLLKLLLRRRIRTEGLFRNSITLFRMFRAVAPIFRE